MSPTTMRKMGSRVADWQVFAVMVAVVAPLWAALSAVGRHRHYRDLARWSARYGRPEGH